jgi:hypothetical protein
MLLSMRRDPGYRFVADSRTSAAATTHGDRRQEGGSPIHQCSGCQIKPEHGSCHCPRDGSIGTGDELR